MSSFLSSPWVHRADALAIRMHLGECTLYMERINCIARHAKLSEYISHSENLLRLGCVYVCGLDIIYCVYVFSVGDAMFVVWWIWWMWVKGAESAVVLMGGGCLVFVGCLYWKRRCVDVLDVEIDILLVVCCSVTNFQNVNPLKWWWIILYIQNKYFKYSWNKYFFIKRFYEHFNDIKYVWTHPLIFKKIFWPKMKRYYIVNIINL